MTISESCSLDNGPDTSKDLGNQINVPPDNPGSLWKVIISALRCPQCGSSRTKAQTGKRVNGQGFSEQYRQCSDCQLRFRVILE